MAARSVRSFPRAAIEGDVGSESNLRHSNYEGHEVRIHRRWRVRSEATVLRGPQFLSASEASLPVSGLAHTVCVPSSLILKLSRPSESLVARAKRWQRRWPVAR